MKPLVGIDLGGTNINVGVVDLATARLLPGSRVNKKTQAVQGNDVVISRIVDAVHESLDAARLTPRQVGGIGIGAPGAVNSDTGILLKAVNLGFTRVPLARILTQKLKLRTYLENDVNAAVYGEWKVGASQGRSDLLGVWIGTGVGGGLVLSGRLYAGGFFTAGEIGHTTLIPGAPLGRRSLEENCSRTAISDRILALIASGHDSMLKSVVEQEKKNLLEKARKDLKDKGKLSWQFENNKILRSRALGEAFRAGDPLTHTVVHESAQMLGTAIAGAVTILSLPHVVLGGGFTEALGAPWVKAVRDAVRARVFPAECRKVEVVGTALKDNAGIIGAALLARDNSAPRRR